MMRADPKQALRKKVLVQHVGRRYSTRKECRKRKGSHERKQEARASGEPVGFALPTTDPLLSTAHDPLKTFWAHQLVCVFHSYPQLIIPCSNPIDEGSTARMEQHHSGSCRAVKWQHLPLLLATTAAQHTKFAPSVRPSRQLQTRAGKGREVALTSLTRLAVLQTGLVAEASGSAYIETGRTKLICAV